MTVADLVQFIADKMRMSHVYQPVVTALSWTLVGPRPPANRPGAAPAGRGRASGVRTDHPQVPLPVLKKHGIVTNDGELVRLTVGPLDLPEKARVSAACEQ